MKQPGISVLIQARSDSTRLPGKVFRGLPEEGDLSILETIYRRMERVRMARDVLFLVPENDRKIIQFCQSRKLEYLVGPETDVRARYRKAASRLGSEIIVRATGDNPCVDPAIADETIQAILNQSCDLLSFSNLPLGIAVEAIRVEALQNDSVSPRPEYREHVSLHIKHNPSFFRVVHLEHPLTRNHGIRLPRLTVDTAEDLAVVRNVFRKLGNDFRTEEVLKLQLASPDLFAGNTHIEQITFPVKPSSGKK